VVPMRPYRRWEFKADLEANTEQILLGEATVDVAPRGLLDVIGVSLGRGQAGRLGEV